METFTPSNNIFGTPMTGGKDVMEKRIAALRVRHQRQGISYLFVAGLIFALYSFAFFRPQLDLTLSAEKQIAARLADVNKIESVEIPSLNQEKSLHKAAYDEKLKSAEEVLDKVFPKEVDRIGITKRLENFATELDKTSPPFELNSITFGETMQKSGYKVLPISMSISSSTANFKRFLQLVNISGQLDREDGVYIRLMEISNISFHYRGLDPQTGQDLGVDFSVKLNAYSR